MELTLKTDWPGLVKGKIYKLTWKSWAWMVVNENGDEYPVNLEIFESIKEHFASLNPTKRIASKPHKGYTTDLLMTENYFIYYQHSKGNHYNVFGNHFKYFHDINTGEFIPDHQLPASAFKEPVIIKERVIVADWNRLFKHKENLNPSLNNL